MSHGPLVVASLIALLSGCASVPANVQFEDFMRVGVEPEAEARRVEATLVEGGFERTARAALDGHWVALSFGRFDGRRAVRVVSRRGVVASLDSHEPDGVRERHGDVGLAETPSVDVDGDGRPEVVLTRSEGELTCVAVIAVAEDGTATRLSDDADALAPGSCVNALEDVDGDRRPEAIVELRWSTMTLDERPPSLRVALPLDDGAFRATGMPVDYASAERLRRELALAEARARLDVPTALRLGVELAAIAHLGGAPMAAQAARFDVALSGLVLTETQLAAVRRTRATIARGWQLPGD